MRADGRPAAVRPAPSRTLTEDERQAVLETTLQPDYAALPPGQIVPRLADKGIYLVSESTFYRVLRAHDLQHHREPHNLPWEERFETPAPCPPNADAVTAMAHRLSRDCARDRLRGQGHLCQTKIYRGDGVWHCERGVRIPAIPSSRAASGARRMESGLHGLESEADVCFEGLRACSRQVYHSNGFCFSGPRACRGECSG